MKILLVYASAGMGHKAAAAALYDFFKKSYPKEDVRMEDILSKCSPGFARLYSHGYYRLASTMPWAWGILYSLARVRLFALLFNYISRLQCSGFIEYLRLEQPDAVISTHFFPAQVVSFLKRKGLFHARLISVITDFGVHPLWVLKDGDTYIVGCDATRKQLTRQGVKESSIKVLGIPVNVDFLISSGVKKANFSVLLVTGSFGLASSEKVVDCLAGEVDLTVVCGRNYSLYQRLRAKAYERVRVFGFTDQMPVIMSEVDLVITKPGGLGISEALAKELPMIFIDGIPGQETENAMILENAGCAVISKSIAHVKDLVIDFRDHPEKLADVTMHIKNFAGHRATEEIGAYVCAGGSRASG